MVVPVFNNDVTIRELVNRLHDTLTSLEIEFEIILVNDGSTDESWRIIKDLAQNTSHCVGVCLSRNFGQHPAINAGMIRARGDLTVLMDADLQDRPEELPKMLAHFAKDPDIDIVYTNFVLPEGQRTRWTSRLFYSVYTRATGINIPANLGTYRMFSTAVRLALLAYPERGAVYGPIMAQMGFESRFVAVSRDSAGGRKTSYTFSKRLALAVSSLIAYSSFLYRLVAWTGLALTTMSSIYLVVLGVQYLSGFRVLVNGQLLLLGITVLTSGVILMTVGVLTAYTFRIFQEVLARPRFHVAREMGTGISSLDN